MKLILTYVVETPADTTKTKNMLKTMDMKTLRVIKKVSLKDQIRSKMIKEDLEIQEIVRFLESKTTILEKPHQQNNRSSMSEMGKG
ncbi:hypothetical protein Trydic_g491 [Trypoxylus dichotomus]